MNDIPDMSLDLPQIKFSDIEPRSAPPPLAPLAQYAPNQQSTPEPISDVLVELQHRVQVLENALAGLQDTNKLEERITERVVTRLPPPQPSESSEPPPSWKEILSVGPAAIHSAMRSSWLLLELLGDARDIIRMLFDFRYRNGWLPRTLTCILVFAIYFSDWWFPLSLLKFVGTSFDKCFDFFVTFFLGLYLIREVQRYREWKQRR